MNSFLILKDPTVGKLALGYKALDSVFFRGSYSQAFRAPNLITINESIVARQLTVDDSTCFFVDPNEDDLDCSYSTQRVAQGSRDLDPEESDNYSVGVVFEPADGFTLTFDYWSIEKDDTIGLFGEDNHAALDLLLRIQHGDPNNCAGVEFNPAIIRADPDADQIARYTAAGICPAGDIERVNDRYANLETRTIRGYDIGVYYSIDTDVGGFHFKYNASILDSFEQEASGESQRLFQAQQAGILPPGAIEGFQDLIGQDGNQCYRHNMSFSWKIHSLSAALNWHKVGSFYETRPILPDGSTWTIPALNTFDLILSHKRKFADVKSRFNFGIKNIGDRRAPLASGCFGYFSDAYTDYGRYFYLSGKVYF